MESSDKYTEDVKKFNELYSYTGEKDDYVIFNHLKISLNLNCTVDEFKIWMDVRNIDDHSQINFSIEGENVFLRCYKKNSLKLLRRVEKNVPDSLQILEETQVIRNIPDSLQILEEVHVKQIPENTPDSLQILEKKTAIKAKIEKLLLEIKYIKDEVNERTEILQKELSKIRKFLVDHTCKYSLQINNCRLMEYEILDKIKYGEQILSTELPNRYLQIYLLEAKLLEL